MIWLCFNFIVQPANPTSSIYTSLSHADATLPASSTPIDGFIGDNVLAGWQREKEEQREQRNARRRASYQKKKEEGMINLQKNNQVQHERRKEQRNCRTPNEQGKSSAKRKADYARRKNTLCAESIAMPRPDLASALSNSHTFNPHAHCPTLTLPTITQQFDIEQIDRATTDKSAPTYIRNTETDGSYPINDHLSFCIHSSVIYNDSIML